MPIRCHDANVTTVYKITKKLIRVIAKRLTAFRCVDACKSDAGCCVVSGQHVNRVTVDDADDFGRVLRRDGRRLSRSAHCCYDVIRESCTKLRPARL